MDVLSDILDAVKLQGTLYFSTHLGAPWGIQVPAYERVARFHLVTRGRLWVRVARSAEAVCLEPGDLVLVPHGAAHALLDSPDTPAEALDRVVEAAGFSGRGALVYGGADTGSPTRLVCGHFALDEHVDHPLLRGLPPLIAIRREDGDGAPGLEELIRLIAREAVDASAGSYAVVGRLSEVLFIQALRVWAARTHHDAGLLSALGDPQLGASLERIHERPGEPCSLESLARSAGMSRTQFAERFKQVVGMSPMRYVTLWRMQRARRLLVDGDLTLERIAEQVGYESAAAFSRVFRRSLGEPPGSYRRRYREPPGSRASS